VSRELTTLLTSEGWFFRYKSLSNITITAAWQAIYYFILFYYLH
jgi:hypothetical protein